jgi:hypothetical protein
MFFDVEKEIDDKRYIILLLALQASDAPTPVRVAQFLILSDALAADIERDDLLALFYQRLIDLTPLADEKYATGADDEEVSISRVGLAD